MEVFAMFDGAVGAGTTLRVLQTFVLLRYVNHGCCVGVYRRVNG